MLNSRVYFNKMSLVIPYAEQVSPLYPSRECEIFVYKIPRSVSEQELRSIFEKYGDIFHLRLIQRPEKRCNYAFVRFLNRTDVKIAVLRWNAYEIRKGERISVCRSIENKKLVLFNVPRHLPSYEIKKLIGLYTTGLQDVQAPEPRDGRSVNSGLAFLVYETHTCASIAKKTLNLSMDFSQFRKPMRAEWHTPGLTWDDSEFLPGSEPGIPFGYHPILHAAAEFKIWSTPYGYYDMYRYYSESLEGRNYSDFHSGYRDEYCAFPKVWDNQFQW